MARLRFGVVIAVFFALAAPGSAWGQNVDVVVRLDSPGVAEATARSRVLGAAVKRQRLDLRSPTAGSYLDAVAFAQQRFEARLAREIPGAVVYRRYRIVLNGLAVSLPAAQLPRLARLAAVYPSTTFTGRLDRSVAMIGATSFWAAPGVDAGSGMKIAILDDGLDQSHPFFSPAAFTMPAGFPKGQAAYTTRKVIVARAFPPRGLTWRNRSLPFDPVHSSHATHVSGIAAGNAGTLADNVRVSGVAPRAYLGNYKVLTVPTEGFGLNGNAPEIAAGIEAAVSDGMDVINLSLGEPEIEPTRDLVALAIEGAAAAGVPTVAAAGNEYGRFQLGSVGSPASAASAISVASVSSGRSDPAGAISSFSSAGPTPLSLRLKPDVAAPGSSILSASPESDWSMLSGTSMAAPHVAGAVALLRKRHPAWTPAQLKSALVTTGSLLPSGPLRTGGGLIAVARADAPLLFAEPSSVSFGLVPSGQSPEVVVKLTDAGGGAGTWTVSGIFATPRTVTVPGELRIAFADVARTTAEDSGYVVLQRGDQVRRIPYWFRVATPQLPRPTRTLTRTGRYTGSTVGKPRRVQRYRYPVVANSRQLGPEQVFRFALGREVSNFGVAVLRGAVQPRVVRAGDENRLVGIPGLPLNINPYVDEFGDVRPVAGAIRPAPGAYDLVFDSRAAKGDRFTFRFWVDDVRPPSARLLGATARGGVVRVRVSDAGAGVDPRSLDATVDGRTRSVRLIGGIASVGVRQLTRGTHALVFTVSDYQEAKNMENVTRILPNTRVLRTTIRVP
jgi:subtilisin family serine protease